MKMLLVAAALAVAAPAFAQTKTARPSQPTPAPVQRIDGFDDEEIAGNLLRPDGDSVISIKGPKHPLMVRARTTFVPELVKSSLDR
jgi:hypothetical protein